ncbi:hypothetical protein CHLRE_12g487350v5 [Chlamydomonas reinhardtii]|uniref:Centrosomal protein of 19 kDa n=1 Tax=Chlamydomonas reinhardtii TaxID=3055 RepID=A0A2K3D2D1_CHLRE|nr:uncharacterized protein CHLRE_12g487350v5 [Chlamydomonas reinhardtii]PNW74679.1 hypothetical protein CHLRE_12g487350v5 [Chlamydomonas reinhardtii]
MKTLPKSEECERWVKLNGVQPSVDVDRLTKKVIRSFPRKLEPTSVKYDQVRKLVVKLLEYLAAAAAEAAAAAAAAKTQEAQGVTSPSARVSDGAEPSGRISDSGTTGSVHAPLPALSPRIDPRSPGGRLLPHSGSGQGGPGHHHRGSIESTMSRFSTSTGGDSSDSEEDLASALDELSKEMAGVGHSGASSEVNSRDSSFSFRDRPAVAGAAGSRPSGSVLDSAVLNASVSSSVAAGGAGTGPKSRFAAEAEKLTIGLEITDDLDLNKVSEVELKIAKQVMEEDFKKNQLRPGDPGYVYDKQVEFTPAAEANDWDDSGDEDEEPAAAGSEEPEVDWAEIQAAVAKPGAGATLTATANTPLGGSSADDSSPLRGPGGGGGVGSGARPGDSNSPYNSNDWP